MTACFFEVIAVLFQNFGFMIIAGNDAFCLPQQ